MTEKKPSLSLVPNPKPTRAKTTRVKTRDGHGRLIRTLESKELDHRMAQMRGVPMTYQRIAEILTGERIPGFDGPRGKDRVAEAVKRAMADVPVEAAEMVLEFELQKLDHLEERLVRIMATKHIVVSDGRVITDLFDEPLIDDAPEMKAIDGLVKIHTARARLLNLGAINRLELTGKDGGPVSIESQREILTQYIDNLRERR